MSSFCLVNAVPVIFMGVYLFEILLMWIAPQVFAVLARVPLGPARIVRVPPAAARALTDEASTESDYRTAPTPRLDLARLPGESITGVDAGVLTFFTKRSEIMARRAFSFSRKCRPIVFVRMRAEAEQIVLEPRYYPSQCGFLLTFILSGTILTRSPVPLVVMGLFLAIPFLFDRRAATGLMDAVEAEVALRVRRSGGVAWVPSPSEPRAVLAPPKGLPPAS